MRIDFTITVHEGAIVGDSLLDGLELDDIPDASERLFIQGKAEADTDTLEDMAKNHSWRS